MSLNYNYRHPKDPGTGEVLQDYNVMRLALQANTSENGVVSSVITFNDSTVELEVTALGFAAALKWIPTTDTQASVVTAAGTANYDHIIPPNMMRRFVIPPERAGITSIAGANIMNGLYNRYAIKSTGIGSVLTSQF